MSNLYCLTNKAQVTFNCLLNIRSKMRVLKKLSTSFLNIVLVCCLIETCVAEEESTVDGNMDEKGDGEEEVTENGSGTFQYGNKYIRTVD